MGGISGLVSTGNESVVELDWQRHVARAEGPCSTPPSELRRLILPRSAGVRPVELAQATGLSRGYCAQIRDGKRVRHVRHWAAFQLAGLNGRLR